MARLEQLIGTLWSVDAGRAFVVPVSLDWQLWLRIQKHQATFDPTIAPPLRLRSTYIVV